MVYLEHSGSKFWRCEVDGNSVKTCYGKVGTAGRSLTKEFDSQEEAEAYFSKQEASKRKVKYVDAEDPNNATPPAANTPQKRKATASATVTPSPAISKKAGLGGFAAPDVSDGNVVDPGAAGIDPALASRVHVHDVYHARLALVDLAQNTDKYYILQLLVDENPPKKTKGQQ